jgi:DNA mismatch repair protein MutS
MRGGDRGAARTGGWLHDDPLLREDLRAVLRALPDIGRALGRVVAGRGSPRDLGQLRDGLARRGGSHDHLSARADLPALLANCCRAWRARRAGRSLCPRAGAPRRRPSAAGRLHRRGLRRRARRTARDGRAMRAARSPRWRRTTATETGIAALKIRHNGVLGYFIEVPARHADR